MLSLSLSLSLFLSRALDNYSVIYQSIRAHNGTREEERSRGECAKHAVPLKNSLGRRDNRPLTLSLSLSLFLCALAGRFTSARTRTLGCLRTSRRRDSILWDEYIVWGTPSNSWIARVRFSTLQNCLGSKILKDANHELLGENSLWLRTPARFTRIFATESWTERRRRRRRQTKRTHCVLIPATSAFFCSLPLFVRLRLPSVFSLSSLLLRDMPLLLLSLVRTEH